MFIFIICFIMAVFCFGYYAYAATYAGFRSAFLFFWLLAGIAFLLIALLFKLNEKQNIFMRIPKFVRVAAVLLMVLGAGVFCIAEALIITRLQAEPKENVDYLIVLGAQVKGTRVSKSLAKRLDEAADYLAKNENTKVIVSGGQGVGEDITEAEAMSRYLLDKGIDSSRIIKEEESTSTKENLVFSYEKIAEKGSSIAIVSNNFHIYRAEKLAKKIGIQEPQGLAAPTDSHLFLNYMVREGLALIKEKLQGNI